MRVLQLELSKLMGTLIIRGTDNTAVQGGGHVDGIPCRSIRSMWMLIRERQQITQVRSSSHQNVPC